MCIKMCIFCTSEVHIGPCPSTTHILLITALKKILQTSEKVNLKTPLDEYKVRLYPASVLVGFHMFHV